jgi:hypothetical protein
MLISTLPELPGMTFEVRGLVIAQDVLLAVGGPQVHRMVKSLIEQAESFGADGIVDVRTVVGHTACVLTGTAVKLLS